MTASYLYLAILAVHVVSLALFGGIVLATELRRSGVGMRAYSLEEILQGLRAPKRVGLALALLSGLALFSFDPVRYLRDPWFWSKLAILCALAVHARLTGGKPRNPKLAASITLALWTAVIVTGRGPATIKDVMHSMVDPSGDYVFESVQQIGDQRGSYQLAPRSDADWDELKQRLIVLTQAPDLVAGRHGARMRDRSKNPQSESQPEQIDASLSDPAALARRARKLQTAAQAAIQAVDKRDIPALLKSIDSIDKACENCHLHYWYPNDKRAQQAAKEDGVADD